MCPLAPACGGVEATGKPSRMLNRRPLVAAVKARRRQRCSLRPPGEQSVDSEKPAKAIREFDAPVRTDPPKSRGCCDHRPALLPSFCRPIACRSPIRPDHEHTSFGSFFTSIYMTQNHVQGCAERILIFRDADASSAKVLQR
jgi:hypothetical protein